MSDYRVRITVRNARLLRAIENAGHRPGQQFAALVGIEYGSELLPYLNLTRSPINREGLLRVCAWALCDYLKASPSDLWSDTQLKAIKRNSSSFDFDAARLHDLIHGARAVDDPVRVASRDQAGRILHKSMESLSPCELQVIYARFFGDYTLEELAKQFDTSRESIRVTEMSAMRKLRDASRVTPGLAGTAAIIGGTAHA